MSKIFVNMSMDASILQHVPTSPGIYLFKDKKGAILYIGKAKNLLKRVTQYFAHGSVRKQDMMQKSEQLERIPVANESEALYLEDNLIKKHQPPFNNLLKGDGSYAYIKIPKGPFPPLLLTRKKIADGAQYIGPKHDTKNLKQFLQYTRQIRGRRGCTQTQFRTGKVCSDFYFGLCKGRCQASFKTEQKQEEYVKITESLTAFFKGDTDPIKNTIKADMAQAIEKQHFERAGKLRDMYGKIEQMTHQQTVVLQTPYTGYIAAITPLQNTWIWVIFHIVQGKLGEVFRDCTIQEDIDEATVKTMLEIQCGPLKKKGDLLFSASLAKILPEEITHLRELIDRVRQGFLQHYAIQNTSIMNDMLTILQQRYALKNFPYRMECVDISHLSGDWTSGGLSCMEGGLKNPKGYRRYRLPAGSDDYASLEELLRRRILHSMPDLLVIDGGKGQLMVMKKLFQKYPEMKKACENTDIISLGKGEARKRNKIGSLGKQGLVSEEILTFDEQFRITKKNMVYDDADRRLLELRDEAHRFANAYRKKQMSQERE